MDLHKIKNNLKRGDMTAIAKNCKVTRSLVYAVLSGNRKNDSVLTEAIRLATSNKEIRENLLQQSSNL